jgi:hypothetical protein
MIYLSVVYGYMKIADKSTMHSEKQARVFNFRRIRGPALDATA